MTRRHVATAAVVAAVALSMAGASAADAHRRDPWPRQHPAVDRIEMACDHTVWATVRVEQLAGVQWAPAPAQWVTLQGIGGQPGGWRPVGAGQLVDGGVALLVQGSTPVLVRVVLADGTLSAAAGVPEMPAVACG